MSGNIRIETCHQFKKDVWAHGETIQLYLFPPEGNYKEGDFLWRVSSATVESECSDFTVLYGVKRWIMPLSGEMKLIHRSNDKPLYQITLKPYDTHCFRGEWETRSEGVGRDFNLMLKEESCGCLSTCHVAGNTQKTLGEVFPEAFDERCSSERRQLTVGVYTVDQQVMLQENHQVISRLAPGELLLIHYQIEDIEVVRQYQLNNLSAADQVMVLFMVSYQGGNEQ